MEYLTPEDYKRAEENGIREALATNRFYNQGWEKERAITEPPRKKNKYRQLARANGIVDSTYQYRIDAGWTPEKAATTPPGQTRKRDIPEWAEKEAEKNGITRKDVLYRLWKKWTLEEAVTIPIIRDKSLRALFSRKIIRGIRPKEAYEQLKWEKGIG